MEASQIDNFIVTPEQKKFDTAEDVEKAWLAAAQADKLPLDRIVKITLGGNSYGYEACEWVAKTLGDAETP